MRFDCGLCLILVSDTYYRLALHLFTDLLRIFNSMSTSNILKAFGSVKSFSRELEKHLLNNGHGDMESSASDSTENISEGNLDYDHFPSGSYEEETFYDLSDDEASESDREKKRNLDAVRVAFVRGEKISEEECDALEKAHLRRMGYTAGGRSSRNLSPIKRAYEALQEKNRNSKSGVAEESSNSADDNPSVGSMFLNEDSESEWPDISDFSSTSSSSRYQKKDKDWRHERRNTSHEHRQARAEGNGMDYDMLDDFMNAQHSGSDTSSKERGPIPLSRLLSVFRRCDRSAAERRTLQSLISCFIMVFLLSMRLHFFFYICTFTS